MVVADSHAQEHALRVKDSLIGESEVSGYVKPGKSTDILIKTATSEINNVTKNYTLFLWMTNDVIKIILKVV